MDSSVEVKITVGQHFDTLRDLSNHPSRPNSSQNQRRRDRIEAALFAVTLDEYRYFPPIDDRYPFWLQLFAHCRTWADKFRAAEYVPYKTEADIMSYAMMQLREVEGHRVPPPWMRTIRALRDLQAAQTRTGT